MMSEIAVVEYSDRMVDLFVRSGLEIHYGEPEPAGLLRCFAVLVGEKKEEAGYAGLIYDGGEYILRCVAVEEKYRGQNLGAMLVEAVLAEAVRRGAERMFLTAKVPGFYEKMGFRIIKREDAPFVSKCFECPQFHHGCESEVMQIDFVGEDTCGKN